MISWFLPKFFFESKSTTYSFQVLIYSLALDNASNRSEERNTSLWDYTGRQFLGSLGNGLLLYPPSMGTQVSFINMGLFHPYFGGLKPSFFHGLLGSKGWNWHFAPYVTGGTPRSERFKTFQASTFRGVSNVCFRCRVALIKIVIYCPPWKISNQYLLINYTYLWFIVISRFSIGSPVNQSRPNKWNGWLRWSIEPGFPLARLPTRSLVGCSGRTWGINTRWTIPHRTDNNRELLEL